jgi:hypothetical protein
MENFGSSGRRRKTYRTDLWKTSNQSYERRYSYKSWPSLSLNTSIHRDVSDTLTIDHRKIDLLESSICLKTPTVIRLSKPCNDMLLVNSCTNPHFSSVLLSPGSSPLRCRICILPTGCTQGFTVETYCSSATAVR